MADINVSMTSTKGVQLNTKDTICKDNIIVTPKLQSRSTTYTGSTITLTPSSGYAGLSSVTINAASVYDGAIRTLSYPVKGDVIKINNNSFRVIRKVSTTTYLCLACNSTTTCSGTSGNIQSVAQTVANTQLGSTNLKATVQASQNLETWYVGSTSMFYKAQYQAYGTSTSSAYTLTQSSSGSYSPVTFYPITMAEIITYLEATSSASTSASRITGKNLATMFSAYTTSSISKSIWLGTPGRSSLSTSNDGTFLYFDGLSGQIKALSSTGGNCYVYPAFQIDLSQVDFSIT